MVGRHARGGLGDRMGQSHPTSKAPSSPPPPPQGGHPHPPTGHASGGHPGAIPGRQSKVLATPQPWGDHSKQAAPPTHLRHNHKLTHSKEQHKTPDTATHNAAANRGGTQEGGEQAAAAPSPKTLAMPNVWKGTSMCGFSASAGDALHSDAA